MVVVAGRGRGCDHGQCGGSTVVVARVVTMVVTVVTRGRWRLLLLLQRGVNINRNVTGHIAGGRAVEVVTRLIHAYCSLSHPRTLLVC